MKIAQIAPVVESIPPTKYGGTERVVYELCEELIKKGHEVTLFASGNSLTSAKLISICPKPLRELQVENMYGPNAFTMLNIGSAYKMQNNFDIIHDHNGFIGLPAANVIKTPVIMTYHGDFHSEVVKIYQMLKKPYVVSISHAQVQGIRGINVIGNVYNGLTMDHYPFSSDHDGYLLYVGRISEQKGIHHAMHVAKELDLPLIIAAKLDDVDEPYFNEYVKPRLSEKIKWIGEVNEAERNRLMSKALCFLHPVRWKEPFGLTLIEAMSCGCPVVAFNEGSIPEIIADGKTGFVVSNVEEMIEAVRKISTISRYYCRRYSLENFNAKIMTDRYEELYYKILEKNENGKCK